MSSLRFKNAALLAAIETVEGTAETLAAGTDGMLVENVTFTPDINLIATDEVTGSLDPNGRIPGGMRAALQFSLLIRGSGAAATAPKFGRLLRACGWAEQITASAVPAAAEACGAGGSTTTAQLGTSASSTAQAYRGMPINFTGTVAGSSFITDYTAGKIATLTDTFATINATTNYQIPANVLYKPTSDPSLLKTLTLGLYRDGVRWLMAGCRGTFTFSIEAGGLARFNFRFTGMFISYGDVALPVPTYDTAVPPIFRQATGGAFKVQRVAAAIRELSLDAGNTLPYPPDPNAAQGFGVSLLTRRNLTGRMDPARTLAATRDLLTDMQNGTQRIVHAKWGSSAGNRFGVTIPTAQMTGNDDAEREGVAVEGVPFDCVGQDAGMFFCHY